MDKNGTLRSWQQLNGVLFWGIFQDRGCVCFGENGRWCLKAFLCHCYVCVVYLGLLSLCHDCHDLAAAEGIKESTLIPYTHRQKELCRYGIVVECSMKKRPK